MKITDITVEAYRWTRTKPIRNGKHTYASTSVGLIKIQTDEGITGIGVGSAGEVERATIERLKPMLIGEDPINVERLWHKMWVPKLIGRRRVNHARHQRDRYFAVGYSREIRQPAPVQTAGRIPRPGADLPGRRLLWRRQGAERARRRNGNQPENGRARGEDEDWRRLDRGGCGTGQNRAQDHRARRSS